ncbi:MFS transporter [Haloarculaceae archaeon H-GB11]|nr:MFS transporter [Haloarculaceae archaeon H-GB11]
MGDSSSTVGEVIDGIPLGRFHRRMLAVTGVVWATTAVEILIISFTIPIFVDIWSLSSLQAGLLGSAGLLGMIFGNSLGGWYADRFGRKTALAMSVAFFSVFTGLTSLAVGFYSAFLLRLLTGLGVGGTVAIDASFLTEHVPTGQRGRYLAYLEGFFALGNMTTVVLAWLILPGGLTGGTVAGLPAWRVFYLVAAAPLVLVVAIHYWLGESPYFLASKGRAERASERLREIAAENGTDAPLTSGAVHTNEQAESGFRRLFQPDVVRATVLTSVIWFGLNFGYYGVFIWLPDTVEAAGYVGGLYQYLFVVAVFQLCGIGAAAVLVDRIGRKTTLTAGFTLAGLSTATFTVAIPGSTSVWASVAGFRSSRGCSRPASSSSPSSRLSSRTPPNCSRRRFAVPAWVSPVAWGRSRRSSGRYSSATSSSSAISLR